MSHTTTTITIMLLCMILTFNLYIYYDQGTNNTHDLELLKNNTHELNTALLNQEMTMQNLTVKISHLETSNNNLKLEVRNKELTCDPTITDLMFIEEARTRFDSIRTYSESYDCSVFTNDFTDLMKEFDIELFTITSFNDTNAHKFNCIPFDAQKGYYDNSYGWNDYVLARRNVE